MESNFVRKHSLEQAEKEGTSIREASARVFSNASGSYSSNVNLAVENSTWEEENELQEMYLSAKHMLLMPIIQENESKKRGI